jgi:hypothetical protein
MSIREQFFLKSNMTTSVEPDVDQKYILINIDGRFILKGDSTVQWHKEIADRLSTETDETFNVMGGGWVKLDTEVKQIEIWGESTKFGKADKEILEEVLSKSYVGYNLIFKL